jgi:telomerase reverse transcriptase
MMYVFPRQFGLHNVFTSSVDTRETVQPFKDYTLREDEIKKLGQSNTAGKSSAIAKCPKRLRGEPTELIHRLQLQHARCSYERLLEHYCSTKALLNHLKGTSKQATVAESTPSLSTSAVVDTESQLVGSSHEDVQGAESQAQNSIIDHATPITNVVVFCQRVLARVVPDQFFGHGDIAKHNRDILNRNVDKFIRLRRFETLTLHEVIQGMKVCENLTIPRASHIADAYCL